MAKRETGRKPRSYRRWLWAASVLATRPSLFRALTAIWTLSKAPKQSGIGQVQETDEFGAETKAPASGAGPSRRSLEAQREVADMGHLWVPFFGGGLFLGLATLLGFLWGLQTVLGHPGAWPAFRPTAIAHAGDSATLMRFRIHAPGLFPDPPGDLRRFQNDQAAEAPGYAWVDRHIGIISIPVEQAMERIAEAGWPRWEFAGVVGGAAAQPVSPNANRDTGKAKASTRGGEP